MPSEADLSEFLANAERLRAERDSAGNAPPAQATSPGQFGKLGYASPVPLSNAALTNSLQQLTAAAQLSSVPKTVLPDTARQTFSESAREDILQGKRPGVEFDRHEGAAYLLRLRMEMQSNKEKQEKVLENYYGKGNVRVNEKGGFVATVFDDKGKPKDVVVDPEGADLGDMVKVIAQAPEVIGTMLATKGINPAEISGFLNTLKFVGKATAGQVAGTESKQVLSSQAEGIPIDLGELAANTAKEAVSVGAQNYAVHGILRLGAKLWSPMGVAEMSDAIKKGQEAESLLKLNYGLPDEALPSTPGSMTGNTLLLKSESYLRQIPGASTAFEKLDKARRAGVDAITKMMERAPEPGATTAAQRLASVPPPVPEGELGQRMATSLAVPGQVAERQAENLAETVIPKTARQEIVKGIEDATGISAPTPLPVIGEKLRESATALQAAHKTLAASEYNAAYDLVEGGSSARIVSTEKLAKNARALIGEVPTDIVTETRPTGLFDEFGRPMVEEVERKKPLVNFIPTGVMNRLRSLADLESDNSLKSLVEMRNSVTSAIAEGEATPGYDTAYLYKIRGMLTDSIKSGLKEAEPTGAALTAWEAANKAFGERAKTLNRKGIAEIFRPDVAGNFLSDSQLVQRALTSDDYYNTYKDVFGATEPVVAQTRRALADNVMGVSEVSPYIKGGPFVARLEAAFRDTPQLAADTFGKGAANLRASGLALKGNLDAEELRDVMRSGQMSAARLRELQAVQQQRDNLYKNSILKDAREGVFGKGTQIDPHEFVERFIFRANPDEVKQAVDVLKKNQPDLVPEIRQTAVARIFDESRVNGVLKSSGIEAFLNQQGARARLEAIAGPETVRDMQSLVDFLKPEEGGQRLFKGSGTFAATGRTTRLIEHGDIEYADKFLKSRILGLIYTSPAVRNWLSRPAVSDEAIKQWLQALVVTKPMLKEFGAIALDARHAWDRVDEGGGGGGEVAPTTAPAKADIQQFLQNASKMQRERDAQRTNAPAR